MTKVRVAGFSVSLDGFGAGPEQSLEDPLGKRGRELHQWFFGTRTFRAMTGEGGGSDGVDEHYAHRSMDGFGAFILGRNMFGPVRGPWPDESWKGWWGDNPPYHAPSFVLMHHRYDPIETAARMRWTMGPACTRSAPSVRKRDVGLKKLGRNASRERCRVFRSHVVAHPSRRARCALLRMRSSQVA